MRKHLSRVSIIREHYKSSIFFFPAKKPAVNISCNFVGPKVANALHVACQKGRNPSSAQQLVDCLFYDEN